MTTIAWVFLIALVVSTVGGWIGCAVLRDQIAFVTRQRDLARQQRDLARRALQADLSPPLATVLTFPTRGA